MYHVRGDYKIELAILKSLSRRIVFEIKGGEQDAAIRSETLARAGNKARPDVGEGINEITALARQHVGRRATGAAADLEHAKLASLRAGCANCRRDLFH